MDSGALLFKADTIRPGMEEQEKTTATGIAAAMQAMDCRAVGIAARDLAGGIELLKKTRDKQHLNWLSMNLVDSAARKPIFTPFITTRVGSTDIAILGLTDEQAVRPGETAYTILPWQEILPKVVAEIGDRADMVILLSSYPEEVNKKIAETVSEIDLILESGHSPANRIPQQTGNALLAKVANQGKYVGMLRINWTEAGKWEDNSKDLIRAEQNQLDRINWLLGRMEKRAQGKDLSSDERYSQLLKKQEQSVQKIAALKKAAEQNEAPCSFSNRFIALKSSMPEDREVQKIIDQTTLEVNKLNQKRRTSSRQRHADLALLAGWQQCRQCHPEQTAFWQTTNHARAFQTLAEANQQFNEDCLLCHVTLPYYDAARVQSKRLLLQLPEKLNDVGCESCHGPAAAHSRQPENEKSRPAVPDEEVCKRCHTPERDDNFVFADKVVKVRCPKG